MAPNEILEPNVDSERNAIPGAGAIQDTLAAAKELPETVPLRAAEISRLLIAEQRPKTELQRILWSEVGCRASCLEFLAACEAPILRTGAKNAPRVAEVTAVVEKRNDLPREITADDYLAAAISSEYLEKLNRHRSQHSAALSRALNFLGVLAAKEESGRVAKLGIEKIRRLFPDRVTCEQFLITQQQGDQWRCPHCGEGSKRCWLKGRKRWECGHCHAQIGMRQATVAEHSPLPLERWFWSVLLVCCDLEISAAALAESVEIPRIATARRILATILVALQSPDRERLLMGLPGFLIKATAGPELGVQFERVLKTGESSIRQLAKFVSNKP